MKMILSLVLMLSFKALAHVDDPNCIPHHGIDISDLQKLLNWNGALEHQIRNAPCKTKSVPDEEEMKAFIESKAKSFSQGNIHGVNFQNESTALIDAFKDLTTAKDSMGFSIMPANQKKIQTEYQINPACNKVLCAMEKIWGKKNALKMLYIKLKHNYNTSELAFQSSDRFYADELDEVLIGLEDIPAHLTPMGKPNQRLTHYRRGYTLASYGDNVVANAVVMLFDSWDAESSSNKQYTIFHEIAHNISAKLKNMDESPEWLAKSGWIKKGDDWEAPKDACFISNYGTTNPWEDFAEVVSAYRYNGIGLKKKCPEKYDFVKDQVYRGIEYTETKLCSPISEEKLEVARKEVASLLVTSLEDKDFSPEQIKQTCGGMFQNYPLVPMELSLCGIKLNSESSPTATMMNEALKKAGIQVTSGNRNQLIEGVIDNLITDDSLQHEVIQKMTKLNSSINQIVEKSFEASNSFNKPLTADDYGWRLEIEKCAGSLFEGKPDEAFKCQAKQIVVKDRSMQKWKAGTFPPYQLPEIYNEAGTDQLTEAREERLTENLVKLPAGQEAKKIMIKDFKEQLKFHHLLSNQKIDKIANWKKLSPEEFCDQTYGRGTPVTAVYGFQPGASISGLHKLCVEAQSKSNKRFAFKESEWNELVRHLVGPN